MEPLTLESNFNPYLKTRPITLGMAPNGYKLRALDDTGLDKVMLALTRGAAIKAFGNESTLQGLFGAESEYEQDKCLEDAIEQQLSNDMAMGGLSPMSEKQFNQEFVSYLKYGELNGLFSKLKKSIKKVVKKVSPIRLVKKAGQAVKKVASKAVKIVKKVAPVALGGAALMFGGPYVLAAAKGLGAKALAAGKAVVSKFGTKFAVKKVVGDKIQSALSPQLNDEATQIATQMAAQDGLVMESPEAQRVMHDYMLAQQQKLEQMQPRTQLPYTTMPPPQTPFVEQSPQNASKMPGWLVPLGIAGSLFLATRG